MTFAEAVRDLPQAVETTVVYQNLYTDEWVEKKRAIALLGGEAQSTWLSWVQSDAYVDAFDPKGIAESDPAPQLLIAWDTGQVVTTQQYS